jgi:hypothetical protein
MCVRTASDPHEFKAPVKKGDPVVSIDAKKKELIGAFLNKGKEWQQSGQIEEPYPTKQKVSDEEMSAIKITYEEFHRE